MLFAILVAILCIIPLILIYIDKKWSDQDKLSGIPGPRAYPIIGSLIELWPYMRSQKVYLKILDYAKIYGDTFRVRFGPKLIIITRDLKAIETIVSDQKFIRGHEYKSLKPMSGDGLLVASGERWFKLRKLLTPAFHFQILERFIPIYEEQTNILIDLLKKKDGKVVNIVPLLYNMALDIIAETSMGVKLNAQSGLHKDFVEAIGVMLHVFTARLNNGFLTIDWIFHLTSLYREQQRAMTLINNFVNQIIEERRTKLLQEIKENGNVVQEYVEKKHPALLELMLRSEMDEKPLTNDDIRNEVKTFMMAGHETTSNASSFILYNIAKYPKVQERVYEEINSEIDLTKPLTIKVLNSLFYMDCVIKETLRLTPAGTLLPKRCLTEVKIGDYDIPADTTIMTFIYGLHMDEKNFKNCESFDPNRWMKEVTVEERNPFAYQPFSSGLRNCIGQRFALLEIKTVIVKLLTTFKVELGTEDFVTDIIECGALKSKNGVQLKFIPR
uniref:CSON009389 protein n=1 Tax=Culicoides sonorensis TaxID=179676 RepID=A0A336M0N7_CULSO